MPQVRWFQRASRFKGPLRVMFWSPLVIVLTTHLYEVRAVFGRSMQPTLNPDWSLSKDHALFGRISVLNKGNCHREDIVVLKSPMDPKRMLIKRVVAEEGDTVRTLPPYPLKEVVVPPGHLWIEGDEPFNSDDSNIYGPVPRALIESKLICLVWPPERFGKLPKPEKPTTGSGPTHRRAMAAWERAAMRQARVTPKVDIDLS